MSVLFLNGVPVHTHSDCDFAVGLQLSFLRMSALRRPAAFLPLQESFAFLQTVNRKSRSGL